MSALPKMNGSRAQAAASLIGYGELRDKVAALVRPERAAATTATPPQSRPITEAVASPITAKSDRLEAPIRDLGSAVEILGRATSCFELLTQKLEQVEGERDQAVAQLEDQKRAAAEWQNMIDTVQARLRDAERDLMGMRQEIAVHKNRADSAERHAERDLMDMRQELAAHKNRADSAERREMELQDIMGSKDRHLTDLEKSYTSLHNQVVSSFGFESSTYRSLEALVDRFQGRAT